METSRNISIPLSSERAKTNSAFHGIEGLHHVTAIAGEPQPNIDFYTGVLGLRLVKLTVNFDDPTTYHLYYGDGQGHPGTILTFFPWPGAYLGRIGTGQLTVTSFAVPDKSLPYWRKRLRKRGVEFEDARSDFGEERLFFQDPDGLQVELVSTPNANPDRFWERGPVPIEHAIRGFHHVTLSENGYERTASLLTDVLGFKQIARHENRFRYAVSNGSPSTIVDLVCAPEARPGRVAVGTVHHVAWRTATDAEQVRWRDTLTKEQYDVTPIIDRQYFHSIYFREPGGVLFEIATDPPGFAIDESVEQLGTALKLPPSLEQARSELKRLLPSIKLPKIGEGEVDEAALCANARYQAERRIAMNERSTEEVLRDHLELAQRGDIETDIARNMALDCVLMTSYGIFRGHEGVREAAKLLDDQIGRTQYVYRTQLWYGELAFLEWSAQTEQAWIDDCADSYWIKHGRVQAMTIHYSVNRNRRSREGA